MWIKSTGSQNRSGSSIQVGILLEPTYLIGVTFGSDLMWLSNWFKSHHLIIKSNTHIVLIIPWGNMQYFSPITWLITSLPLPRLKCNFSNRMLIPWTYLSSFLVWIFSPKEHLEFTIVRESIRKKLQVNNFQIPSCILLYSCTFLVIEPGYGTMITKAVFKKLLPNRLLVSLEKGFNLWISLFSFCAVPADISGMWCSFLIITS